MSEPTARPAGEDDDPAPLVGSWPRLYALVLLELGLVIGFLLALTRAYR